MKKDNHTIIPMMVRGQPEYIQQAYIREFMRVEEATNNALCAKQAADQLFHQLARRVVDQYRKQLSVSIIAHICEMDATELIPPAVLNEIKRSDPHPFFAVYDVGGEGISTGTLNNKKERKIWSFAAIKELARKLKESAVGIIIGHNKLNEDTKPKYGRLVYAFTKTIKDSLHAIAVAHISNPDIINQIKSKELDVCSIEGDVVLARETPQSNWFIKSIDKIQNLALGSSSITSPGFVGAGILATIQELSENKEK